MDGNVYRVLSRLSAEKTPIDSTRGQILFKKLAQQLISLDRPGDFNEAIMDLGATVCKPRNPACSVCPAMTMCKAYEMNLQAELPVKAPALKKSASVMNYLLLWSIRYRTGINIRTCKKFPRLGIHRFLFYFGKARNIEVLVNSRRHYILLRLLQIFTNGGF